MSDIVVEPTRSTSPPSQREERERTAAARYRALKWLGGGVLGAAALAGLALFARSFPDLRRYLRMERM